MSKGLDIFKRTQRLQGGTGDFSGNPYYRWPNEGGIEPGILPPNQAIEPDYTPQTPSTVGSGAPQGSDLQVINSLGFDPSKPTYGSGSGEPTRRGIDIGVSGAVNAVAPGFGWLAGKGARGLWHLIQNMQMNGASNREIKQAVQQQQQSGSGGGGGGFKWPNIFGTRSSASGIPGVGVGISPTGQPAVGREWWSNDFGRWTGEDKYGTTPGNYWNQGGPGGPPGSLGLGFNVGGSGRVGNFNTAIGFGGSYGGGSNAGDTSRFMSGAGYNRPYTAEQWANMPGAKKYPAPTLAGAWGGATPRASYEQYLQMFHPIGSGGGGPNGIGGGTPALKPANQKAFAMGTSSVNPGLKIFHQTQLKRKPKL